MSSWFLLTTIQTAFRNLLNSPLRTVLALTGITIGCAAIVSMLQIGLIAEKQILEQLQRAGAQLAVVEPRRDGDDITMPPADVDLEAALRAFPGVQDAAFWQTYGASIVIQGKEDYGSIIEATDALARVTGLTLSRGSFDSLEQHAAPIALGPASLSTYEGDVIPLGDGSIVRIGFDGYRIVGNFETQDYNPMIGIDFERALIVPKDSLKRLSKEQGSLEWRALLQLDPEAGRQDFSAETLVRTLRDDYALRVDVVQAETLIRAQQEQRRSLTFVLVAMGSISLFVGTVGIANVMLASVAERRQEIGLRMAIGASPSAIMLLFLVEAIVLCAIGGLFGVVLGIIASNIYADVSAAEFVISYGVSALGLTVSALGGLIAGFYPARKSSKLDPVLALQTSA